MPHRASFSQYLGSSMERCSKADTVANNFAREAMPEIHEPEVTNGVEPVRLFYVGVKLTIPNPNLYSIRLLHNTVGLCFRQTKLNTEVNE
jgi:hypothetical protein